MALEPHNRNAAAVLRATALSLALVACSSSSGKQPSGGGTPAIVLPQVVYKGGPLLTAPSLVTVTFSGDPLSADLQSFGRSVTSSAWWDTIRAGYCASNGVCVGDGPPGAFVELPAAPASSYTDSDQGGPSSLQDWLAGAITSGALPAPDAGPVSNTLYVIYLPATTTVTFEGIRSCVDGGFIGYHNSMTVGSQELAYVIVVECAPMPPPVASVRQPTLLESTTITASHEIAEAATDPSVTKTAYYLEVTRTSTWGWMDVTGGGEIADLCVDPFGLGQDRTVDGTFTVQRIWSNASAAARLDPCNPAPSGEGYFNAAPRESLFVLDVGGSATFGVDAFADQTMSNWTLSVQDWSESTTASYLAFSIAGGKDTDAGPEIQVHDGSTVQVTVTLLRDPGALSTGEADGALVSASRGGAGGVTAHWWPFVVMSKADAADAGLNPAAGAHGLRRPVLRIGHPRTTPAARSTSPGLCRMRR
jgi:hypothetical protein